MQPVREGTVLWEPTEEIKSRAAITKYLKWLESEQGLSFNDYDSLWEGISKKVERFVIQRSGLKNPQQLISSDRSGIVSRPGNSTLYDPVNFLDSSAAKYL